MVELRRKRGREANHALRAVGWQNCLEHGPGNAGGSRQGTQSVAVPGVAMRSGVYMLVSLFRPWLLQASMVWVRLRVPFHGVCRSEQSASQLVQQIWSMILGGDT